MRKCSEQLSFIERLGYNESKEREESYVWFIEIRKNYRKQIILGPVFKFLEACFELVLPLFMAHLVDVGIRQNDRQTVIEMALWMLVMSLVGLFLS